ncbi:hypothetical protein GCM10023322_25880 [Rugosimonospora acidiphila]|uniref:DUF4232 domain-containing protein n=1 Tax=Rugosimonospora acidiphila TaxID=556531 RepID=A0ABP9RRK7_9ACTN
MAAAVAVAVGLAGLVPACGDADGAGAPRGAATVASPNGAASSPASSRPGAPATDPVRPSDPPPATRPSAGATDVAAGGPTGGAKGPTGGARPCALEQLTIRLDAGTSAKFEESAPLILTNTSARPCTLAGLPGLRLGGPAGAMPTSVLPQPGATATVLLNPGDKASYRLVWNKYENQGDVCPPFPSSIIVTPPGAQPQTLPWIAGVDGSVCGGTIKVYPITEGGA